MKMEIIRTEYDEDRTIGRLELDGEHFCWTLEDKVRQEGVKVYGETAIPEGTYAIEIAPFRGDPSKMYPHLQNVPMFEGICIHGGNGPEDTLGCVLVGFNRDSQRIWGSAVRELVERIEASEKPWSITVRNGG